MIVVTGASGKLGQHVIEGLLKAAPASEIVAAVRTPEKAAALAALGVTIRQADYAQPETLATAFAGADKLLLISGNELGARIEQHRSVIAAAKAAGVKLIAYTSIVNADTSGLLLAAEHRITEQDIKASGIPYVLLRDGWYLENHTEQLAPALAHGAILGAAAEGKFSAAARADYAAAAVTVLTTEGHKNKTYELAGDSAYSLAELAAEVAKQSGKPIVYTNLPAPELEKVYLSFHLPEPIAHMLADSDLGAAKGELASTSADLHTLIGRPTTTLAQAVTEALK